MYANRKANTQKQKAYDFFNSYEWEKVTWPTFYQRVRNGWDEPWEEKIKKKAPRPYTRRDNTPKGKRANEMIRYNQQPEPRAAKTLYRNRLNWGYPKEKAVLTGEEWKKAKQERAIAHPLVSKPYVPKPIDRRPVDERNFLIEITYPKEVARVFRREYARMMEEIERELTYTEEKTQIVELNNKLTQLEKEKNIFNSYNPS